MRYIEGKSQWLLYLNLSKLHFSSCFAWFFFFGLIKLFVFKSKLGKSNLCLQFLIYYLWIILTTEIQNNPVLMATYSCVIFYPTGLKSTISAIFIHSSSALSKSCFVSFLSSVKINPTIFFFSLSAPFPPGSIPLHLFTSFLKTWWNWWYGLKMSIFILSLLFVMENIIAYKFHSCLERHILYLGKLRYKQLQIIQSQKA